MDIREFRKRYQYDPVEDLLGQGGFGRVYKAYDSKLKQHYALKFFRLDAHAADGSGKYDLISEIARAINFRHDNVCRYYGADELETVDEHGQVCPMQVGIMELVPGGKLNEYLYQHREHLDRLLIGVLRGLSYLHQLHPPIIHRDLKPGNVLVAIEDGLPVAKITDFGISRTIEAGQERVSKVGTYDYMAPEQIFPDTFGVNRGIGTNVDLWSFGVMLYQLLTWRLPFAGDNPQASQGQIIQAIVGGIPEEILERFPDPYRTVLKRCLVRQAALRAQTADELIRIFEGVGRDGEIVLPSGLDPEKRGGGSRGKGTEVEFAKGAGPISSGEITVVETRHPAGGGGQEQAASAGRGGWKLWMIVAMAAIVIGAVGFGTYPRWHKAEAEAAKRTITEPPPTAVASLGVSCNEGCSWTVNGQSVAGFPVGADGRYTVPADVALRIVARPTSGDAAAQEKTVTPVAGQPANVRFDFHRTAAGVSGPPVPVGGNGGSDHTGIDALMQSGFDRQLDDDLAGAYKAYSTAEKMSGDGYRKAEAVKSKENVLAACRDRGISCFGK